MIFPVILVFFEWGLKQIMHVESTSFSGPSLAIAGLSFLIPLTKPKILDVPIQGQTNVIVTSVWDSHFIAFTWILIFGYLFAWSLSCYVAITAPLRQIYGVYEHLVIGGTAYLLSLLMMLLKEKI
jgi:hypothetical protein